jgi:selenocysteine-specific elongation factor
VAEFSAEMKTAEKAFRDILERLAYAGKVTRINRDMYFHADVIGILKKKVVDHLTQKKEMLPVDFKNMTNVSRKYMIPLLEYFDETKLTIRVGDKRVLRN